MAIRRKPTLAFGLGVAALVVAASGTALAVPSVHSAINGKTIKNHSIAGNKLKNNTVTGKQIKESTLGIVPRAKNAQTVGGKAAGAFEPSARFIRIPLTTMNKGPATKTLGTFGPLTFTASCSDDSGATDAVISLTTSANVDVDVFSGSMTALTPSSAPFEVAESDTTNPLDIQVEYPTVVEPGGAHFVMAGSGGLVAEANADGADCAFWGDLQNDGP